ncbi:MAG: preprotein translocase subunit SecA [Planctomycetales bacterium]
MLRLLDSWRLAAARLRLNRAHAVVGRILDLADRMAAASDSALLEQSLALRYRAQCGEVLERLAPEGYALVRETARRSIGLTPYPVQLLAGLVLQRPTIAEMQTGEGKTLAATLPLYLHALSGKGAHLATANDYLAQRDADWMRPVFAALGMTVGVVVSDGSSTDHRTAYACDVTYGTAREFGFDFLRDRLRLRQAAEGASPLFAAARGAPEPAVPHTVQRGLHWALIDEADSLLIDEARVPLVISAAPEDRTTAATMFRWCSELAATLQVDEHFTDDSSRRRIELTAPGRAAVRDAARPASLAAVGLPELFDGVERAVAAQRYFVRDRQYVVERGRVVIVDEFTGRPAEGRQWRDGLHQAVEAKEGLTVTPWTGSAAQITVQELFSQYEGLAGMTGTASAGEFQSAFGLATVAIPTHRPERRERWPDRVFRDTNAKWQAIANETREQRERGRPVLIGTRSIDRSEELSQVLTSAGIAHRVLHARHLAAEAQIVAQAGEPGCVTVATNMAGRGTDIRLGPQVAEAGGLHVIGTELHDASRIDRQLFGRCARQGDSGSYRQFLSLEDEILAAGLGAARAERIVQRGLALSDLNHLAPQFYRAQRAVEHRHRSDRRLLMHQAHQRRTMLERMGQDPWLDVG